MRHDYAVCRVRRTLTAMIRQWPLTVAFLGMLATVIYVVQDSENENRDRDRVQTLLLAAIVDEGRDSRSTLCQRLNRITTGIRLFLAERRVELNEYAKALFADADCEAVIRGDPPPPLPPPPATTVP